MTARSLLWITSMWLVACGGRAVGDEGYFAGEPLPPPEKSKAKPALLGSASASETSPAASAPASSGPSCDTPPPGGFPNCNKELTNMPCIAAGIGECTLKCTAQEQRPVPCPQAKPL